MSLFAVEAGPSSPYRPPICHCLSCSMAASAAPSYDCFTTWPHAGSLPPEHRKSQFESAAADQTGAATVAASGVLNPSDEGCGQEPRGPRFCSPRAKGGGRATSAPASRVEPRAVTPMETTVAVKPASGLQRPLALPADMKSRTTSKSSLPVRSREVDVAKLHPECSANDVPKITKAKRENGQVKSSDPPIRKNVRKSHKPVGKQPSDEDLGVKNHGFEAVHQQLQQKLTEIQGELKDLTQRVDLLERFQDNCLAILESKDSRSDTENLVTQQEATTDPVDSMLLLETLQDELKLFNETARKQMEELQAYKVKLKVKEEERTRFLEQQAACNSQVNDFTTVLKEMEQLLEM